MERMFPGLPQDLTAENADDLRSLLAQYQDVARRISDRDTDLLGERTMKDVVDEFQAGVEEIEQIRAELDARDEVDKAFQDELDKLKEKAGVPEPTAEEKATDEVVAEAEASEEPVEETPAEVTAETEPVVEAEAETVVEPEPVAASAKFGRRPLPKVSKEREPVAVEEARGVSFTASAGIDGVAEGRPLDKEQLAKAMISKRYRMTATPPGVQEDVVVASVDWSGLYPEERRLHGDSSDTQKVNNVVGEDALVASGGLCAPVTPYYELQNVSVAARPVRDALVSFNATRGGINVAAVPTLADVTTAVGIKTAAEDALGGTFATKTCQEVDCPSFSEVELSMVYHCVQFGNLNSRAFPEQVAQFNELVLAAHARTAETALLDGIATASTAVTQAQLYGGASTILDSILFAAAGMRSRHRMRPDARFRALFPAWAADFLVADLVNSQFIRFSYDAAGVTQLLSQLGRIDVTWILDGETGAGQVFGAQSAGALLEFPDDLVYYIFPEGSFLFLDGGSLELGIVRDSSLNSTNDFQIFGETFENVAFVGVESLKVTLDSICFSGETAGPATAITCSAS